MNASRPPLLRRARPAAALVRGATVLATAALLLCACATTPAQPAPAPAAAVDAVSASPGTSSPTATSRADAASTTSPEAVQKAWARSFARLQKKLDGPAGVAVLPVGSARSVDPLVVGTWRRGVAWSTAKVPVTVAAERRSHSKATKARARLAITRSDNRAAEQLWSSLGSPRAAAVRTQDVVADAGDRATVVQSRRVRAGFTAFGQTMWDLDDQARFAAGLSCLPDARPVVALMGQVTKSQRWGLGQVPRTAFKGGWGPAAKGYLVRQLGIITLADGSRVGVAIAVSAPSGFDRGTRDLTTIARWLSARTGSLPGGTCPRA